MHKSLAQLGLTRMENAVCASGALLLYLEETQKNALAHLNSVRLYNRGEHLLLDPTARSNLELTETMRGPGASAARCCGCWTARRRPWAAACCAPGSRSR